MAHRYRPAPVGPFDRVRVWSDSGGTVPAVLTTPDGQPLQNNDPGTGQPVDGLLIADGQGALPEFLSVSSPIYVGPAGSPPALQPSGEDDGAEASQLKVYGTPAAGKVPTWNDTTKRLEWATPSGGSSLLPAALTDQGAHGYFYVVYAAVTLPGGGADTPVPISAADCVLPSWAHVAGDNLSIIFDKAALLLNVVYAVATNDDASAGWKFSPRITGTSGTALLGDTDSGGPTQSFSWVGFAAAAGDSLRVLAHTDGADPIDILGGPDANVYLQARPMLVGSS